MASRPPPPEVPRSQLTSSVDIVPLLLSIATGSDAWRGESSLAHLAGRADLAAICADAGAPGRPWVLHATDEDVTEFASDLHDAEAPRHVVALRTAQGKLGLYSNWAQESIEAESAGQEVECYDYAHRRGPGGARERGGRERPGGRAAGDARSGCDPRTSCTPRCRVIWRGPRRKGMGNFFDVDANEGEKAAASHLHVAGADRTDAERRYGPRRAARDRAERRYEGPPAKIPWSAEDCSDRRRRC